MGPPDAAVHAGHADSERHGSLGRKLLDGGLGARYPAAGCEHFGISTIHSPTRVVYRWLVADPNNPGQLTYFTGTPVPGAPPIPVAIPHPVINVIPPAQAGAQPVVYYDVQVPELPPPPKQVPQFGDARWVKVFEQDVDNEVDLNDLAGRQPRGSAKRRAGGDAMEAAADQPAQPQQRRAAQ